MDVYPKLFVGSIEFYLDSADLRVSNYVEVIGESGKHPVAYDCTLEYKDPITETIISANATGSTPSDAAALAEEEIVKKRRALVTAAREDKV